MSRKKKKMTLELQPLSSAWPPALLCVQAKQSPSVIPFHSWTNGVDHTMTVTVMPSRWTEACFTNDKML